MRYLFVVIISISLLGCGQLSEEELWQQVLSAEANRNADSTIQVCQLILKEYPNGAMASAASFKLAETYYNRKKDFPAAVDQYKKFVQQNPNLKATPLAMFLIGFIYNNDLHQIDSARAAYEQFISQYPNHDLADDARFEMENLGKSPDEIISHDAGQKKALKSKKKK